MQVETQPRAIQRAHWVHQFHTLYIALEDCDFFWTNAKVIEFDGLWKQGWSLWYIADYFQRDPDEVLVLYLDRMKKGGIKKRSGGLFGTKGRRKSHQRGELK